MPTPRQRKTPSQQIIDQVIRRDVNNFLGLSKYYRSAELMLRQAEVYRIKGHKNQLLFLLMKFISLVIETIPKHRDFQGKSDAQYARLRKLVATQILPEVEKLKVDIDTTDNATLFESSTAPDTQRLTTSNLPSMNWSVSGAPLPQTASSTTHKLWDGESLSSTRGQDANGADYRLGVEAGQYNLQNGDSNSVDLLLGNQWSQSHALIRPAQAQQAQVPPFFDPATLLRFPAASKSTLDKHALLPSLDSSAYGQRQRAEGVTRPLYPAFDASPIPAIRYGNEAPSAPPMASSSLMDSDPALRNGNLAQLPQIVHPQPELQLGPQEIGVINQAPPGYGPPPPDNCSCPTDTMLVVEPPVSSGGVMELKKQEGLRQVHVSLGLMEEFLKYAARNTQRGIETCGILAGKLDPDGNAFNITTLIVPKQEGTSDTVQALNEEDIFEAQDSRALYPMGWIHTHPTQTCFLSSVDVHTQCGYQTMLDEALAIVMAPTDSRQKCGIFRLTTPGGLSLVQKCPQRGFHSHPPTSTGQPLYDLCAHVYLNPRVKHEVLDLR